MQLSNAETLVERSETEYVQPIRIGRLYAHAEEHSQVLLWLERAYEEGDFWLVQLAVDPDWDALRSDPRFHDLLSRVGLPN